MRKAHAQPQRESCFGEVKSFIKGQFSRSSSSLRPVTLLSQSTPPPVNLSQDRPWGVHIPNQDGSKVKASGRSKTDYGLELSSDFGFQVAFLCRCSISLIRQDFFLLCPCHDCSLQVRDKAAITLFLLAAVNSSTGAHLYLI